MDPLRPAQTALVSPQAEDAPARGPRRRQVAASDSEKDEPDWPGPFSTARKLVRERQAAVIAREEGSPGESSSGPLVDWSPSRPSDALFGRRPIPTLFEMSVRILVDNAEFVESMEGIPDVVRRRVAAGFAARRKLIPETLSLFFQGCPGEIVLPDCTLVGEAEMTAVMAQTDARRLEVKNKKYDKSN
jgi:DNA repair protein RAD7